MQATAAKACRAPAPEKKVQIMSSEYRGAFVVYTIASSSGCPGYFTYPFFYSEAYVYSVRTYFLCHIVNWQKRGYNVNSTVTSCLNFGQHPAFASTRNPAFWQATSCFDEDGTACFRADATACPCRITVRFSQGSIGREV